MADGHAGITAKQQHGNRLAHHKTATNNNHVLALYRDIVKIERPYAGFCGARSKAFLGIGKHRTKRCSGNAVDVLRHSKLITNKLVFHLRGKRAEHQATMNA